MGKFTWRAQTFQRMILRRAPPRAGRPPFPNVAATGDPGMRAQPRLTAALLAIGLAATPLAAAVDRPVSEREKFAAEQAYRKADLEMRHAEQTRSRWTSPLVLAIIAAAIAALGNAGVAFFNGRQQRILEKTRADLNRQLEAQRAKAQLE